MPEKLDFLTPTALKVLEFFFVKQLKVLSNVLRLNFKSYSRRGRL